jgi:hypothetical protein
VPSWLNKKDKSAKGKDVSEAPAQSVAAADSAVGQASVDPQTPVSPSQGGLDAKTVAVIMAAVAAQSGKPVTTLRFTAIRREGRSFWAASGTDKIIRDRQSFV